MKHIIKLLRVEHYLKNGLIFLPLFFNKHFLNIDSLVVVILGFIAFSMISSSVYIFNDIQDVEKDKLHPKKRNRPIASGKISIQKAYSLGFLTLVISFVFSYLAGGLNSLIYIVVYLLLNISYSLGLKNKPLVDIAILSSGFLIRLMYGAYLSQVDISSWLYLTVIVGSIYLGFGKRRNEFSKLSQYGETREVLKYYNYDFLDKNMTIFMALTITFYSLWTVQSNDEYMLWTVPIVIFIFLRYSLNIETDSDGDPVDVILHDRYLYLLVILYIVLISVVLYF